MLFILVIQLTVGHFISSEHLFVPYYPTTYTMYPVIPNTISTSLLSSVNPH